LNRLTETELARPLTRYLSAQGYTVRSEVKDCDIAAVRGEELLIVELKTALNISLLAQAANRQRLTDSVYVAIPRPSNKWKWWNQSRSVRHLLRRLELGLILVSMDPGKPPVEIVFQPLPFTRRRRARSRKAVLEEIRNRTGDFNTAGSRRTKLVTAYRESAIRIACFLRARGRLSPRSLRAMGMGPETQGILSRNVYGWFERLERGVYGLSARGCEELAGYPELAERYLAAARRAAAEGTRRK
jgi:hypothetical protein